MRPTAFFHTLASLRFSDQQDHTHLQIEAELEFIQYLRKQMYPSVEPVSSVNGRLIETIQLNGHEYYGVVFRKAAGAPLDMETMSDDHFFQWDNLLLNYIRTLLHLSR